MDPAARAVLAAAAAVVISGCVHPVSREAEVLVLEYTLTSLVEEQQEADPGPHCATARIEGGTLRVQVSNHRETGAASRLLFVDPELQGAWSTSGSAPFVTALPAEPSSGLGTGDAGWARIEWKNTTVARVDGRDVPLPHEWQVEDEDGKWRIDATLRNGPRSVWAVPDRACD